MWVCKRLTSTLSRSTSPIFHRFQIFSELYSRQGNTNNSQRSFISAHNRCISERTHLSFFFFFTVGVLIIFKILTMQSCQSNTHLINIFWKIDCQFRMRVQWWLHGRPAWIHTVIKKMYPLNEAISQLIDEKPSQKRLKLWHKRLFFRY